VSADNTRDVWGDTSARKPTRQASGIQYATDEGTRQANPSEIVRAFERIDASEDRFGAELPELVLPGFGERYEDCGDEIPRFCADCGATHTVGRTCYRSECPRCAAAWARRQAKRMAAKLEATRRYEAAKNGQSPYFHHLTISPPDGFRVDSEDELDRTIEALKEVLDGLGVPTGAFVYHPYRGEGGDDRGEWKRRLFDEDREWDDVREELEHSPHFHVIAVADHVDGGLVTKAIEEQTGFVVERITKSGSNVSIYGKYDLARVASYALSHAGIEETETGRKQAAYRYFGRAANLSATDEIQAEMDAAVRSVAPKTLGLSWSSVACQEDRDGREPQSPLVAGTESAYGPADGGEGEGRAYGEDGEPPEGACAGRLMNINTAPRFLEDEEWCERAPHAEELRETWEAWREDAWEWQARIDEDRPPPD